MTGAEIAFVVFVVGGFCAFSAVLAWATAHPDG